MAATLFHNSFAVDDLERARKFYGEILECPEGRKMPNRVDFNFFGHHIVAHFAPEEVTGNNGRTISDEAASPLKHFGVVMTLDDFRHTQARLEQHGAQWINKPMTTQKGTPREQMLMTVRDGCGNAIEFKGLQSPTDVYNVKDGGRAAK
jgi:extradiol dioxygenase family protein